MASAVSHTGDWQRLEAAQAALGDGEAIEPVEGRPSSRDRRWRSPARRAPSSSRPTAAGCRPTSRRPLAGARSSAGRAAQRLATQAPVRTPLVGLEHAVEPREAPRPGATDAAGRRGRRARRPAARRAEAQVAPRPVGRDHGEGHDRLTRPAAPVVDVQGHPRRQEDELGGQRRQFVPGPIAEQREPELGEDPAWRRGRRRRR